MGAKTVYTVINKDAEKERRLSFAHPMIGEYRLRVSKILDYPSASICCYRLNTMVKAREGVDDRFRVERYRGNNKDFVVKRKVVVGDLESALDEEGIKND